MRDDVERAIARPARHRSGARGRPGHRRARAGRSPRCSRRRRGRRHRAAQPVVLGPADARRDRGRHRHRARRQGDLRRPRGGAGRGPRPRPASRSPRRRPSSQRQGLVLGTQTPQPSDDRPKDTIIRQLPQAGEQIAKGLPVDITISTGKDQATVPLLVGPHHGRQRPARARRRRPPARDGHRGRLRPAGRVRRGAGPAAGHPGRRPAPRSTSRSPTARSRCPSVVGRSEAQAKSDLANAGFDVNVVRQEDAGATPGTVLAQTPAGRPDAPSRGRW